MAPVLEHAPAAVRSETVRARIRADARAEHDPVAALDGRDRVELHALSTADRRLDFVRAAAPRPARVALGGDGERPRRRERQRHARARYSSRSARVSTPTGLPDSATSTAGALSRTDP